jgi:hypothetical protein
MAKMTSSSLGAHLKLWQCAGPAKTASLWAISARFGLFQSALGVEDGKVSNGSLTAAATAVMNCLFLT